MQLKTKEVQAIFNKLDMETREGGDTLAFFKHEGKTVIYTKLSHQSGDVKGRIVYYIRQQFKLNEQQFADLKNCPLSKEAYIDILKKKGII